MLARETGLPDPRFNLTTRGSIKDASCKADLKEKKEEVEASRKVGDRMSANKDLREYMKVLSLTDARVWMRVRAMGVKAQRSEDELQIIIQRPRVQTMRNRGSRVTRAPGSLRGNRL